MGSMPRPDLVDTASQALVSLRREPDGARLGGVCQAISRRTGVDVSLVRIATVVLALCAGIGIALYASGWLLLPASGRDDVPLARILPPAQHWDARTKLVIAAVAAAITCVLFGSWTPFGITPVIVVAALLVIDHRRRGRKLRRSDTPGEVSTEPSEFTTAMSAWQQRLTDVTAAGPPAADALPPPPGGPISRTPALVDADPIAVSARQPSTPRPGRAVRALAPVVVLALALATGVLAHQVPIALGPRHRMMVAVAVALGVIGLGLIVLAVTSLRSRLLVPVGVLLCVWLAALQAGLVSANGTWSPVQGGTGSIKTPMTFSGTRAQVTITPAEAGTTVYLQAKASDLIITVPDTMIASIDYSIRYSDLTVASRRIAGFARNNYTLPASAPGAPGASRPTVTLVINATMSRVVILHD